MQTQIEYKNPEAAEQEIMGMYIENVQTFDHHFFFISYNVWILTVKCNESLFYIYFIISSSYHGCQHQICKKAKKKKVIGEILTNS